MRKLARFFGKALYNAFLAVFGISLVGATIAVANYTVTQGAGTTFGSIAVATINYAQQLVCDVTAPGTCANVKAASTAAVATDQALVVAISPNNSVTVQPGNTANTTPWLVDERQMGGTTISGSCVSNYGTAPGAVACPSTNSFVTNANTNGQKTMANSGPVVPASDWSASHASVTALGTSLVAKASSGILLGFNCTSITGGAAGYCIAYNATAAPAPGALTGANVLDSCFFDTTARGCSLSRIPIGATYGTGIVILVSSAVSPFTYTTGVDTAYVSADFN